jgi:outer membrane murein-binding lipoprotein Lpp
MTDIEQMALLFDEKLKSLHQKVDYIKEQTTKTNSRVNHLEDDVKQIREDGIKHTVNCPATAKIDKINEELLEYKMVKRYPKIALGVVVVIVLMYIATSLEFNKKLNTISKNNPQTESSKTK